MSSISARDTLDIATHETIVYTRCTSLSGAISSKKATCPAVTHARKSTRTSCRTKGAESIRSSIWLRSWSRDQGTGSKRHTSGT